MKISNRLKEIAFLVSKNSKIADIGTDHGLVPIFLSQNNISNYIVCSDISEPSLMKNYETLKYYPEIHLRLGNGLSVLEKDEVDEVIIAGMGGLLIIELLEAEIDIVKNLKSVILQPMQASDKLRKYLREKYKIIDEKVVFEDDRFFEIIKAEYTGKKEEVDEIFNIVPKISFERRDEVTMEFIKKRIASDREIIEKIASSKSSEEKKKNLLDEVKILEEMYHAKGL